MSSVFLIIIRRSESTAGPLSGSVSSQPSLSPLSTVLSLLSVSITAQKTNIYLDQPARYNKILRGKASNPSVPLPVLAMSMTMKTSTELGAVGDGEKGEPDQSQLDKVKLKISDSSQISPEPSC